MTHHSEPVQLEPYVEVLRARLPPEQFILLMRTFHALLTNGGALRLPLMPHPPGEREPFTAELQNEMLTLMRLTTTP
ncbi:hypothetical protein [Streptomyces profundus]|uniref:hypothetical protein n=1 Tax=Streptomyces profundus TaxID=2867410 RepID=UPI001D16795B|nr:hypothetical protein [Streptomyces sp. MA3_2.13]UED83584.1 hypothetical protein K4G22_04660 [Streptomyces sp. MA3_2.13]